MNQMNDKGLALIREFEGCSLVAYPDPGTGSAPWTIGYGSTRGVVPGMTISQEEAERLLQNDVQATARVVSAILETEINDNQFSALVCFAFNLGCGNLAKSTLLAKLNQRDFSGAADEFLKWDKIAGQHSPGLQRRRQAERALFLS